MNCIGIANPMDFVLLYNNDELETVETTISSNLCKCFNAPYFPTTKSGWKLQSLKNNAYNFSLDGEMTPFYKSINNSCGF